MVGISVKDANQVLSQLVKQGYLSNKKIIHDTENDSFEAFQKWEPSFESSFDPWVATVDGGHYFSPRGLARELLSKLKELDGRASLEDLCTTIGVNPNTFSKQSNLLWEGLEEEAKALSVNLLGTRSKSVELVSDLYWERTFHQVAKSLEDQGSLWISDLAAEYSLPRDAILNHVVVLGTSDNQMRLMDDSKRLVSEQYSSALQQSVLKHFASVEEPAQIENVCHEKNWDWKQVLEWLKEALSNPIGVLFEKGEIHMDASTNGQTAIYLPKSYRQNQQHEILEFFSANGYITIERAVRNYPLGGMLVQQITCLIQESFPDAILFENIIVGKDSILEPARVAIRDHLSFSETEVFELHEYLPTDLIQIPSLLSNLLETIGFSEPSDGVLLKGRDRAVLVGNKLIQKIKLDPLPKLIQEFAKDRAAHIFQSDGGNDEEDEEEDFLSNRKSSKSKRKNKSKHSKSKSKSGVSIGVLPLGDVAKGILAVHPSFLADDGISLDDEDDHVESTFSWEDDDDEEPTTRIDFVIGFCRKALYSDSLRVQCEKAVNAELQRLKSAKESKAKMSRKDAAAKIRSVEAAFQDSFVTLCYLIQAQAKFISFVTTTATLKDVFDDSSVAIVRNEFLKGPCADLISRITQHCLFQDDLMIEENSIFTFEPEGVTQSPEKGNDTETISHFLPRYCSDVNVAARKHSRSYLSSPPPREPLPVLRESFSGNTGVVLSKLWILCGGESYRGGVRSVEDNANTVFVRPGNMDGFLSFAEENCLTLCGLPFKKLDKKAEKNLLFSRKQKLIALLMDIVDMEANPQGVLDYTIMNLFQQVRGLVVSGSLLRGPILEALTRERKIPSAVGLAMKLLNDMIQNEEKTVDVELVSLIRDCGLARDINKHSLADIERYLEEHQ